MTSTIERTMETKKIKKTRHSKSERFSRLSMRIAALLELVLLLSFSVLLGQAHAGNNNSDPITLTINKLNAKVCLGARAVEVEAELRNVSNVKVAVDPEQILYAYSVSEIPKEGEMGFKDRSSVSDSAPIPGSKSAPPLTGCVILKPGESVKKSVKIDLHDPPFFDEVGRYRLQLKYGQFDKRRAEGALLFSGIVPSNEFVFSVEQCSNASVNPTIHNGHDGAQNRGRTETGTVAINPKTGSLRIEIPVMATPTTH
jgi:hypothetical protein